LYLLWVCQPPLLQVLLVWSPPEKTPVRAFLMKVRNLTNQLQQTHQSSPQGASHTSSTPHPLRAGRYHPGRKKKEL